MQRRFRLRRADDFRRLRQHGATQRHSLLLLSYLANGGDVNRYGFIVGKRLGHAVARNRTRRRLREIVRRLHPALALGYDVVFIARQPLTTQSPVELERIMRELLRRANLLVGEE